MLLPPSVVFFSWASVLLGKAEQGQGGTQERVVLATRSDRAREARIREETSRRRSQVDAKASAQGYATAEGS